MIGEGVGGGGRGVGEREIERWGKRRGRERYGKEVWGYMEREIPCYSLKYIHSFQCRY